MSSSFWVERGGDVEVDEVLRALDRYGVAVDGGLAYGPWPEEESIIVYRTNVSSRGVQVVRDGRRFQIRLLALASDGDFDLAYRLIEVLGGTSIVEHEEGDRVPANQVRERFSGAWQARERAAAIAALRSALASGNKVTVEGPTCALELEASVLEQLDLARLPEIMARSRRRAQADTEDRAWDVLAIVVAEGQARAYSGCTSANVFEALAGGPGGVESRAAGMLLPTPRLDYVFCDAGWLVDLERKQLVLFDEGRAELAPPDLAAWDGFAITHRDRGAALAAHLGERGLGFLPSRRWQRDDDPAWLALEDELLAGAEEHVAHLQRLEAADPAMPPKPRSNPLLMVAVALVFVLVLVPGLLARIALIPFRGWLRERNAHRGEEHRAAYRRAVIEHTQSVRAAPDDVGVRNDRAIAFLKGGTTFCGAAHRELLDCLRRVEDGAPSKLTLGGVHNNLALARHELRLPRLEHRAREAARAAGFSAKLPARLRLRTWLVLAYLFVAGPFWIVSGLLDDG